MNGQGQDPSSDDADRPAPVRGQPSATLDADLTTKPSVPDYELLRRIGRGAYGDVWLARSKATGALRAAKIVWRHTFEDERPFKREFEGIQRFERISREHPSQLALFHIGRNEPDGYFYYVMELADAAEPRVESSELSVESRAAATDGPSTINSQLSTYRPHTLRADLERGRLPAARVLEIGLALSEALGHLHRNGLVHRDVKPSNVIFVNGRPKLADIGLVTDASDRCSIVGTEGYLPPEGPGTPQADIFALGKVLYEAATGLDRRAFPDLPPDIRSWPDAAPVFELNEIILKACAADVRQRFQSAKEMFAELALLQQGTSIKGRRVRRHRIHAVRAIGLAATAVVLATAGVAFLWQTISRHGASAVSPANEDRTIGTLSLKAAEAYRLGMPGLRRGTGEGFRQAFSYFSAATNADPKFVAAYARLFEIQLMGEDHGVFFIDGKKESLNELSATLSKIAPTNAETHAALAIVRFLNQWKWTEAEREFKQSLALDPNCRMALTYYGYFLTRQLRADEARTMLERALSLDPTSPLITKFLGHCEFVLHHYEKALPFYLRATELEPSYPSGHYWAGRVYLAMTNYPQALDELETHEMKQGLREGFIRDDWKRCRDALDKDQSRGYWMKRIEIVKADPEQKPYGYAELYARLGDKPQALTLLGKALAEHDSMENLLADDFWDGLRHESKFKEILKKVGLDPWAR